MASSRGKLVEGVDVFTDDEPKAKKAPTKRTPTAKKTASKSIATAKSSAKVIKVSRADRINELYAEAQGIAGKAVEQLTPKFIEIGELLIEQKEELAHGEWIPWIEDNLSFGEREARHYMRVARNRKRVSDLPSLRQAVALLTDGSDAEPEEAPSEPEQEDDPNTIKMTREEYMKEQQDYQLKIREINKKKLDSANEKYKKALSDLEKLRKEGVGTAAEQKKLKKLQDEVAEMELRRNTLQVIDDATSIVADSSAALARLAAYDLSEDILEEREDDIKAMEAAIENMGEFVKEHLRV